MSKKKENYEEVLERIIHDIENDERYKKFFAQYSDSSVASFIKSYARNKAQLIFFGNNTKREKQRSLDEWQEGAWQALQEIQHKKLFDLSLKWQQEEITNLPGIETTFDFRAIGKLILDYDGIPDISEEDVTIYLQFLESTKNAFAYQYEFYVHYQDFEEIKESYISHMKTGIGYYDYHNDLTENKSLLGYVGLRQEKEEAYIRYEKKVVAKKTEVKPIKVEKPRLSNMDEEQIKFARKFKDLKLATYIVDCDKYLKERTDDFDAEWALMYLKNVYPEIVPIESNENWLKAAHEAALIHKQRKIYEWLPTIYEEYLLKKSTGIRFEIQGDEEKDGIEKWYRDAILDGREMKGEPRNFDF
jgi:hypothetical protein